MRILIIDDMNEMRKLIFRMLEGENHELFEAANGIEGMQVIKDKRNINLVITDLIMPEKEGLETIQELRKDYPDTKIIAISGGGKIDAQSYLPIAKGLGADITLRKPFLRKDLLDAIKKLS